MELRTLEHFLMIAETGKLSEAASRADISASSLSIELKKLEQDIGVSLFSRRNRGLFLTEAGKMLQHELPGILSGLYECFEHARKTECRETKRIITVNMPPSLMFDSFLKLTSQKGDRLRVTRPVMDEKDFQERLDSGEFTFAVSVFDVSARKYRKEILYYQNMVIAVRTDHPFCRRDSIEFRELSGQQICCLKPSSNIRRCIDSHFATRHITPAHVHSCNTTPFVLDTVASMGYIGILTEEAAHYYLDNELIRLIPISDVRSIFPLILYYPADIGPEDTTYVDLMLKMLKSRKGTENDKRRTDRRNN